jgi:hypothetical protein
MTNREGQCCRVCGLAGRFVFALRVLGSEVDYFDCPNCGYLQTEEPYWLPQAYACAINTVDTGILARNQLNVGRVVTALFMLRKLKGRVLDHAGGYGILVRLLRDLGVDAYWRDRYCENLLARGFEADVAGDRFDLLTAFEVFEHLIDPVSELRAMLSTSRNVLLSTELVSGTQAPAPDWWYLGPEHGQHIGFFRRTTLDWMARKLQCHVATDGRSLHMFSLDPMPAYWHLSMRSSFLGRVAARMTLTPRTMSDFARLRRPMLDGAGQQGKP